MARIRPPSGEQLELRHGDQVAVVVEVGGALRAYGVGGRDILYGYGVDEVCTAGRGQQLLPWPNRLEDGSYTFDGQQHQLALTEPKARNAIHGLVRWVPWRVRERAADGVIMGLALPPQTGWPFQLDLEIGYTLSAHGLRVRTTATNVGSAACPFGAGSHPYLSAGGGTVDAGHVLRVPASAVLRADERGLPVGVDAVEGTPFDFRAGRAIRDLMLDHCFTDLARDADGLAHVELQDPAGALSRVWMDDTYRYAMVFTGDTTADVARRGVAIEPMTCPPNAFRSGEAVVRLEPGASATSEWGIAPAGLAP
jgi:aldose 1-epimerase